MQKSVLLIIDMQKGSFTALTPRYDTQGVVDRINQLGTAFREQELSVVFIQHDGTGTGEFEKHAKDWENLDELVMTPSDIRIDKYANDAFYKSDLEVKLNELGVKHLVITGCATDFCVESTVQSAIARDYDVTVVEDGHTTGERPHLSAKMVIDHYNWVWQNMIPTGSLLTVRNTRDILGLI